MPAATDSHPTPAASLKAEKMPGHWLLARLGKRVLRPGGLELTRRLLAALAIGPSDDVVELAPGLGITARMAVERGPRSYTAVERDEDAARIVREQLSGPSQRCVVGDAGETGLPAACASVVYGEAMLTMQPASVKERIVGEAVRLLRPGGRYGIHEIALVPDDVADAVVQDVERDLSQVIHHGVRPLTTGEWTRLFESRGLTVRQTATAPMHLLEPRRIIQDEGFGRAVRFAWNLMTTPDARRRVLAMRRVFRKYDRHLAAVMLIGEKES